MEAIKSLSGSYGSINIGTWKTIPTPEGTPTTFTREETREGTVIKLPFYINNLSDTAFDAEGQGMNMAENETARLLPGWNEYLFTEIVIPVGKSVQWGI